DAIPGGKSLKGNMSRLVLGKMDQWSLASALKNPGSIPELGDEVPAGRGLFESTAEPAQLIQTWWDGDGHDASMVRHIQDVREPLPRSARVDVEAMAAETADDGTPIHGRL